MGNWLTYFYCFAILFREGKNLYIYISDVLVIQRNRFNTGFICAKNILFLSISLFDSVFFFLYFICICLYCFNLALLWSIFALYYFLSFSVLHTIQFSFPYLHPAVCLFICLSICLSIYMSVYTGISNPRTCGISNKSLRQKVIQKIHT